MNRTQKAIIANWVILAGCISCVYFSLNHALPYVALLFLYVRGRFVDDEATVRRYFSNRNRMTIALMVCSVTPFAWFVYRLFSTPSLPDTIGRELLGLSIPLWVVMAIFDRWLYLRNKRIAITRYIPDSQHSYKS